MLNHLVAQVTEHLSLDTFVSTDLVTLMAGRHDVLDLYRQYPGTPEAELQVAADELLGRELQGLLGGRLAHLSAEDRRAVERWARATFGRVMHLPVAALFDVQRVPEPALAALLLVLAPLVRRRARA